MSEYKPAATNRPERPMTEATSSTIDPMPNYGLLIMGVVMTAVGLPLLALALLELTHQVFAWIGLGVALGGAGSFLLAFAENARIPADARPNVGMLILGGMMGIIGAAALFLPTVVNGLASLNPGNVFVWIGIGLILGGGGCCMLAWGAARPDTKVSSTTPVK